MPEEEKQKEEQKEEQIEKEQASAPIRRPRFQFPILPPTGDMRYRELPYDAKEPADDPSKNYMINDPQAMITKILSNPKINEAKMHAHNFFKFSPGPTHMSNQFDKTAFKKLEKEKDLKLFGDKDKDGTLNIFDCDPFDPKKQAWIHTLLGTRTQTPVGELQTYGRPKTRDIAVRELKGAGQIARDVGYLMGTGLQSVGKTFVSAVKHTKQDLKSTKTTSRRPTMAKFEAEWQWWVQRKKDLTKQLRETTDPENKKRLIMELQKQMTKTELKKLRQPIISVVRAPPMRRPTTSVQRIQQPRIIRQPRRRVVPRTFRTPRQPKRTVGLGLRGLTGDGIFKMTQLPGEPTVKGNGMQKMSALNGSGAGAMSMLSKSTGTGFSQMLGGGNTSKLFGSKKKKKNIMDLI